MFSFLFMLMCPLPLPPPSLSFPPSLFHFLSFLFKHLETKTWFVLLIHAPSGLPRALLFSARCPRWLPPLQAEFPGSLVSGWFWPMRGIGKRLQGGRRQETRILIPSAPSCFARCWQCWVPLQNSFQVAPTPWLQPSWRFLLLSWGATIFLLVALTLSAVL